MTRNTRKREGDESLAMMVGMIITVMMVVIKVNMVMMMILIKDGSRRC